MVVVLPPFWPQNYKNISNKERILRYLTIRRYYAASLLHCFFW